MRSPFTYPDPPAVIVPADTLPLELVFTVIVKPVPLPVIANVVTASFDRLG